MFSFLARVRVPPAPSFRALCVKYIEKLQTKAISRHIITWQLKLRHGHCPINATLFNQTIVLSTKAGSDLWKQFNEKRNQ